jgi:hypothetical protein
LPKTLSCYLIKLGNFQAVKKVDQAIRGRGNRRLKDLDMMTVFAHTGPNETLNSLRNKVNILSNFVYRSFVHQGLITKKTGEPTTLCLLVSYSPHSLL